MSKLNENIRDFYNASTPLWLHTWGEHMHHGFYGEDGNTKKDNKTAQLDLIEEIINWADIIEPKNIMDAGCGVGGSARYLAKKFNARVYGITLSEIQAKEALIFNRKAGLEKNIAIDVKDMMTLQPRVHQFDLIWSLESAEHLPNKDNLLQHFYSLLSNPGKCIIVTWCINKPFAELTNSEKKIIRNIEKSYHLPPMIPASEYISHFQSAGFKHVHSADWSSAVAPFWKAVIRSALQWKNTWKLLGSGYSTIKGAWAMRSMKKGFEIGILRFIVFNGEKI